MTGRILLWLSILWVAPLICFLLCNETKFKKNIAVGVTFPYEGREDSEVLARLRRFRSESAWICVLLLAFGAAGMLVRKLDLSFSLWCAWLVPCIVLPHVPYVLCNRDLKKIKRERGWYRQDSGCIQVDTALIPAPRWLSPWMFVLPLALSLVPIALDPDFALLYGVDAACVALFWFCYRYLFRTTSERIDNDARLTVILTQVRRRNWGTLWLVSSGFMAALNWCFYLAQDEPVLLLVLITLLLFVMTAVALGVELHTRRVQEKLAADSGRGFYIDDDDRWIWGLIYYNPNDSHVLINDRVGTNVTFNLATVGGKLIAALTVLLVLSLPLIGPVSMHAADQPPLLTLRDTTLTATCGGTEYSVPLEHVAQAELLEALPEKMVRTNGTGLDTLLKGRFTVSGIGSARVSLDPTVPPFLHITATDGTHYLFGTRDAGQTREIYAALTGGQSG